VWNKTKHQTDPRSLECWKSSRSKSELTAVGGWLDLIIRLSPEKIRALGTFFLCMAVAFRILMMPLHYMYEGSAIPSWEETAIIAGLSSIILKRRTRLKTR
jgi:hypothetical protein